MDFSTDVRPHRRVSPGQAGQDAADRAPQGDGPAELPGIEIRTRDDDIAAMEQEILALNAEVERCAQKVAETHASEARVQEASQTAMQTIQRERTQYELAQSQAASRMVARIRAVAELKQADLAERFGAK